MAADLASYVTDLDLGENREYLSGIARPSVEIIIAGAPVTKGCSKFGGSPDLPTDFKWPQHKLGPYRFIGQVNLADIPKGPHGLPGGGLLSFFYAHDENGESFWGDPEYVRVLPVRQRQCAQANRAAGGCSSRLDFDHQVSTGRGRAALAMGRFRREEMAD
jgi:hypothetical protein